MHFPVYYFLGIVFIGLDARYAFRGYAHGSKPRIINGMAIAMVGVAQFFRNVPQLAIAIVAAGFAIFIYSLILASREHGSGS